MSTDEVGGRLDPERARNRTCGLELLEISASYETRTIPAGQSGLAVVLALVGRARRFLRAAYLLADAGLELEASGPRRAFTEYALLVRWLLTSGDLDTNLKVWQREDARRRLLADDDVRAVGHPGVMPDDDRRNTEQLVDELTATLEERGLKSIRLPNVQMQAADVPEAYVIYRFESQIGIHPTVWAAEHLFSVRDDGSYQLHATAPGREEQSEVETYGSCAYQLLMILATIDGVLTEPMVDPARLDAIRVELERPLGPGHPSAS